ncbi:hypothetical protein [Streptomyces sp. NPDC058326]|uniref:hypothetical protein n=1 Tax=Streptomyces sp. NPDC058326 TaxID=3346447 RepID=UPI0036E69A8F
MALSAAAADAAKAEADAGKATAAAAAKAAGFAYVTAQAAVDAGNSAAQVAAPANDAIQLGSSYVTKDSAASLVVLSAQAAATQAENAGNTGQIETGTVPDAAGGLIGGVFYVVDSIQQVGEPQVLKKTEGCDGWWDQLFYDGDCTMTQRIGYKADLDLYLCTTEV